MSVVPAAPFLVDFGSMDFASPVAEETAHQASMESIAADWSGQVEEAYARGIEEGKKAAEAEAILLLEEQKATLEQRLAAARDTWCEEQGPRIAEQVVAAFRDMENRIAESAERVLRRFLAQAIREQAIVELRAIVQDLFASTPGVVLEISGPEDLLSAVRAGLEPSIASVSYVANDASDVQIKVGASIIETRIAAWLRTSEGQVA